MKPEQGDLFGSGATGNHDREMAETLYPTRPGGTGGIGTPKTIFEAVLPLLIESLSVPVKPLELAKTLDVRPGQLEQWLKKAEKRGEVRKLAKPVRYVAVSRADEGLLFE